ncbi:DUF1702 family protein [Chitinophagaceae bacterium LB-8]|uniref:DUF1702 family protein n=1 Tax=Paraflavisolibacter caeni TaxID=2982496 RepID=A0A9X3BIL8_9BACT|nr:DUF1702 family protein [Paraflavisolibacter caeni]MCU7551602.1 DUF1702 family protein [Paraflavisolibacter caeni]
MHTDNNVSMRMEYIQKLFMDTGRSVESLYALDELITFLDQEPPGFRSVAYEGASFEIGLRDLNTGGALNDWMQFRQACAKQHMFHIDIGLGWAFAKKDIQPGPYLQSMNPALKWMVLDGIGYYYGLFKGRNTIKNKLLPAGMEGESLEGFDQGLGRRLWYMARGNVSEVYHLVENFPVIRHPDLFRGIGIACGYVGGNTEDNLNYLSTISGKHYKQLQIGILLAAISRMASNSVNEDVDMACRIICNRPVNDIKIPGALLTNNYFYIFNHNNGHLPAQIQSELLQEN